MQEENRDIVQIYKQMNWILKKWDGIFLIRVVKLALNIPHINLLETKLWGAPRHLYRVNTRFSILMDILQKRRDKIKTLEDLDKWAWASGLLDWDFQPSIADFNIPSLSTVSGPTRLGKWLLKFAEATFLMDYLPYWDYYGVLRQKYYAREDRQTLGLLTSAITVLEGEDLFYVKVEGRKKQPGKCYNWKAREDIEGMSEAIFTLFVLSILKDQILSSLEKIRNMERKGLKVEKNPDQYIMCLKGQFDHCFAKTMKVVKSGYQIFRLKKCSECKFSRTRKAAAKLLGLFLQLPD